jgi:hypothetical protein
MAFELIIHGPDGDILLGSYHTRTAAEKMAAITIPRGVSWSVAESDGEPRAAQVIDLASIRVRQQLHRQRDE